MNRANTTENAEALAICSSVSLAAGLLSSTIMLSAGGIAAGLLLNASLLPWQHQAGSDADIRVRFWYVVTMILAGLLVLWGGIGLFRMKAAYRRVVANSKATDPTA